MKFRILPTKQEEPKPVAPQGFTKDQKRGQEALNDRFKLNRLLNSDGSLK